ncbi:MAG: hypothetical protein J6U00_07595 [Ruminococcus sp.]|uniref:hypothetical protein n=1 Tax=Ruminococcus sp. TaxID=41978 RepID=UPI001B228E8A|nr:hypothetical protein [Ruminococcus sp.]MBO7473854.1 hypothetical protein [Ruminococcus sp.]
MKNIDKVIENGIGFVSVAVLVFLLMCFLAVLIWCGVRSLLGKTLNLPPSCRKWARMRADVIRDDETDDINVRYFYEYKEFTAKIDGFTVYGDKAVIYVKRNEPEVVKEFIPVPPMSAPVYISCFFMAVIILLFGVALLTGVLL